ncbi:hypothetical protein KAR91_40865 [Candidatus Pacearchaeota archaeon]|nr:hypothetical protein [Candidatus Pacearchaeota archaeon]
MNNSNKITYKEMIKARDLLNKGQEWIVSQEVFDFLLEKSKTAMDHTIETQSLFKSDRNQKIVDNVLKRLNWRKNN